jgi:hypothetical protein
MGSRCIDPLFHNLGTSWKWVVSFMPRPLYPRERALGTHCIRGWVDPRAGLNDIEKWKFLTLPGLQLWPLGRPARSQSLYRLRYPGALKKSSVSFFFTAVRKSFCFEYRCLPLCHKIFSFRLILPEELCFALFQPFPQMNKTWWPRHKNSLSICVHVLQM